MVSPRLALVAGVALLAVIATVSVLNSFHLTHGSRLMRGVGADADEGVLRLDETTKRILESIVAATAKNTATVERLVGVIGAGAGHGAGHGAGSNNAVAAAVAVAVVPPATIPGILVRLTVEEESQARNRRPASSSSHAKYFTVSNAPCKDGAAKPVQAGICRAPSQRPKEQCSIELVAGATTYGVDLPTTIGNRPFWTKAKDEFGKRTVHINVHDPVTEDQYISKSILDNGVWDEYILKIFQHVLLPVPKAERRSKLVVDVGANIAYFSLTAASYGFRTVSFEPMRFNLARILSSIERNQGFSERMVVYNMAVSNSVGALSLKATAKTNAGNFAVQGTEGNKQSTSDSNKGSYGSDYVNSASLDEIIDEDILLMKIDVETFEPFVLDGARNLLCQNIVQHIIIEFDKNQRSAHGGACPPGEMMGWMDRLGYDVRDVIVGTPKINIRPLNVAKMPPNVWFSLRDISMSPAKRMEAGGAAGVCGPNNTRE